MPIPVFPIARKIFRRHEAASLQVRATAYTSRMRAIITGANGTVAPAVVAALASAGHSVVRWDRGRVPIDDAGAARAFVVEARADWFFHIATGSPAWAEAVARICGSAGVRFLFTSSVSVYGDTQQGPFTLHVTPQPGDDYGLYKLECEHRVLAANPDATVVRLGWQIGAAPGTNTMVDFLHRMHVERGYVEASTNWVPACSFLEDTATALVDATTREAGVYLFDGNPGLSFHGIAERLGRRDGRGWQVRATELPFRNTQMLDDRIPVAPITEQLG